MLEGRIKGVEPASLNLFESLGIPIDRVRYAVTAFRRVTGDPFSLDLSQQLPDWKSTIGLPAVASKIAREKNPHAPEVKISANQAKAVSLKASLLSSVVRWVRPKAAESTDRYIEAKADEMVTPYARQLKRLEERIAKIENPKQEFLDEMTRLYNLFCETPGEQTWHLATDLSRVNHIAKADRPDGIDRVNFPLLALVMANLNYDTKSKLSDMPAALPEVMYGLRNFLGARGVKDLGKVPAVLPSWTRDLGKTFKPELFDRIETHLATALGAIYEMLPTDGRKVAKGMDDLMQRIAQAANEGMEEEEIAANVFSNFAPQGVPWFGEAFSKRRYILLKGLYKQTLGREIDPSGYVNYSRQLEIERRPFIEVRTELLRSNEFTNSIAEIERTNGRETAIELLYEKVLGRKIDPSGRGNYIDRGRYSSQEVLSILIDSEEYKKRFG